MTLNHHTLSDFRVGHAKALDELFTQVMASLVDKKMVKVSRISQDGTRVRACAGASSFSSSLSLRAEGRGEERLDELLKQARAQVEELSKLLDDPEQSAGMSARKKAAKKRAARERVERIQADFGEFVEPRWSNCLRSRQSRRRRRTKPAMASTARSLRKASRA